MVTITLHDKDAMEALKVLRYFYGSQTAPPAVDTRKLVHAVSAFSCALLLCDCDKVGKEKEG